MIFKHIPIVLIPKAIFNLPLDFIPASLYATYMQYLALTLPGGQQIAAPKGIPTGGIAVTSKVIGNAITIMIILAVILTLIFLILGGILWITSGGDKSKIAAARSRITFAIIGLIVAMVGFFIVNVVGTIFKVNLF
jgi:hypothetical protein